MKMMRRYNQRNLRRYNQRNLKRELAMAAILPSCMEGELLYLWIFLWLMPQSHLERVGKSSPGD